LRATDFISARKENAKKRRWLTILHLPRMKNCQARLKRESQELAPLHAHVDLDKNMSKKNDGKRASQSEAILRLPQITMRRGELVGILGPSFFGSTWPDRTRA